MANQLTTSCRLQSVGVVAVLCVVAVSMALTHRQCSFHSEASAVLPASQPSLTLPGVAGLLQCSMACMTSLGLRCLSLAYSQEQRECRVYSVFNVSDVTVASPGYQYFRGCPKAIGDSCERDTECAATNSECRNGTCQCVIGYHFYPGPGTCVEVCPQGYGSGFYVMEKWLLNGYNYAVYSNVSLEACVNNCKTDPLCSNVEYRYNLSTCFTSHSNMPEVPHSAWVTSSVYVYYQRDCA